MTRTQLNLGLLAVAAALGVAVFFSQKKDAPGPPLTPLKSAALTRIAVEHPGAPALRLEKRDAQWFLAQPVEAAVDEFEVNALVALAEAETKDKLEGAKLAELELEPPRYTITLDDTVIAFGGVEPLQYRRYVKVGEVVSLIEDPPSAALDKDYADLVAKGIFPASAEIERIQLPKLTLAKTDGKWVLAPPDPRPGADEMQKLVDAWKNARSMWNEQASGLQVKGDRVKVSLKGGEIREFVIAATDPQFKLHRPDLGVTFVLSKALADDMLKLAAPPATPPPPPPETP